MRRRLTSLAISLLVGSTIISLGSLRAAAQVVRDHSLGAGRGEVVPFGNDPNGDWADYLITPDLGQQAGGNLFHSFHEFSIGAGEVATFTGPETVENIISRVTGQIRSEIFGTLRSTVSGADLFLLNPWGIVFGEKAKLDVKGSFHASSADVLHFPNPEEDFYVAAASPVLSTATPEAFGFTSAGPRSEPIGSIRIDCTGDCTPGLVVEMSADETPADETFTFSLVGLDLEPEKGPPGVGVYSSILADGSRVQIASAAPGARIPLDLEGLDPRDPAFGPWGEIAIEAEAQVRVSTPSGEDTPAGQVVIRGERFGLDNGDLLAGNADKADSPELGIDVAVTDAIEIENGSGVKSWSSASGGAGGIRLEGASITVDGGSEVSTAASATSEEGASEDESREWGTIELVTGSLEVSDGAGVGSLGRAGNGGAITIEPRDDEAGLVVQLVDGGHIYADTEGAGKAGTLTIEGADRVEISGRDDQGQRSGITSQARASATAKDAGLISIDTRVLTVEGGGLISSATSGEAPAGNVLIGKPERWAERVTIEGRDEVFSAISARSTPLEDSPDAEMGPGGDLSIHTGVLELKSGGELSTSTSGKGKAGTVTIDANHVEVSGAAYEGGFNPSGIFSQSVTGSGDAGSVTIAAAERVEISDGGYVSVATTGSGQAGTLSITAGDTVELGSGGRISALSGELGENAGDGGSISITAGRGVYLDPGAEISASSLGPRLAGNISIDAGDRFESRGGSVTTEASESSGGKIEIEADEIVYLLDSGVTTSVLEGAGGGGDITIDPRFVVLNRSQIIAQADRGLGGNIQIGAEYYLASSDSLVDASSERGIDGVVEISAPETNLSGELATLPQTFLDAAALETSRCAARTARAGSFVVARRGALPAPPDAPLSPGDGEGLAAVAAPPVDLEACPKSEESR